MVAVFTFATTGNLIANSEVTNKKSTEIQPTKDSADTPEKPQTTVVAQQLSVAPSYVSLEINQDWFLLFEVSKSLTFSVPLIETITPRNDYFFNVFYRKIISPNAP